MKNLAMIACISQDRGIGYQGKLLWNIPEDMQFFKQTTMGHPVAMGGATYASIGRPLPGRENLILSRREIPIPNNLKPGTTVKVFHDKTELDKYLERLPGMKFIIGGASLYQQYLPQAETLFLTEVADSRPADVYFPDFSAENFQRHVLKTSKLDDLAFEIVEYKK